MEVLELLVPLIGLAGNIFLQVLSVRMFPAYGMLRSVVNGFIAGLLFLLFFEVYLLFSYTGSLIDFVSFLLLNCITYVALGYCYFHFINLGETARRVRILREIYDAGKGLTKEEICARYNARVMIGVRIDRLLQNGQIVLKDDRYYIGRPIVLIIAKIMVMLKVIILGRKREFKDV